MSLFWVGPRLSDIDAIRHLFAGAVTIFGQASGDIWTFESAFGRRPDHNAERNMAEISAFYAERLAAIAARGGTVLCYGGEWEYCASPLDAPYHNNALLTRVVSDKMRARLLFAESMPVIPSSLMFKAECSFARLRERFPNARSFVVQAPLGAGGAGTFLVDHDEDMPPAELLSAPDLVVSAYVDGVPLNQHVIVTEAEPVILPSSVQIVERSARRQLLYRGGDFAAARSLPAQVLTQLATQSRTIARTLRDSGYRGVAGVDYMLADGGLHLVEINPRFQASSGPLSGALVEARLPSLQEMHMGAFEGKTFAAVDVPCTASFYVYTSVPVPPPALQAAGWRLAPEGGRLPASVEDGAPTYRLSGQERIAGWQDGELRVPPAIRDLLRLAPSLSDFDLSVPEQAAWLKCMILAYGAPPTRRAAARIGELAHSQAPPGTYNSGMELRLGGNLYVTARTGGRFADLSPFVMDHSPEHGFELVAGGDRIVAEVLQPPHQFFDARTSSGRPLTEIGQFFTDRLRLYPFRGCRFTGDRACKFCEIPTIRSDQEETNLVDIMDTVRFCLNCRDLPFHHILVSGGVPYDMAGWKYLVRTVFSIRQCCSLPIYVMTAPPPNAILDELIDAGADEIGFNMEVFDDARARVLMPGKGKIPRARYFEVMERAVRRLGDTGSVRSVLIPGLEPVASTLRGIEALAERGVMPILSPFTPVIQTDLGDYHPLPPDDLFAIWRAGQTLAEKHGLGLGPSCIACQNNTLAVPASAFYSHY